LTNEPEHKARTLYTTGYARKLLVVPGKRVTVGLEVKRVSACFRCNLTYGSAKRGTDVKGPVMLMMSEVSQFLRVDAK
jgi:hypothetical protein